MQVLTTAVLAALLLTTMAADSSNWAQKFDYFKCYNTDPSERMPNTLDNLIGLLAKFENQSSSYINIDEMAEMIINRYRTDGIIYNKATDHWKVGDIDKETEKQDLIWKVTKPSRLLPQDSYDWREECGLHMLVSHSTDNYPFPGINAIWDGGINREHRGDRNKRSTFTASAAAAQSSGGSSTGFSNSNSGDSDRIYSGASTNLNARGMLNYEPAVHPIENGVMETAYGPVAAGTLLTGLMSINDKESYSLSALLDDTKYMPSQMKSKSIKPVYAATLSGDLGQMALAALSVESLNTHMGPRGRYHNCTTCARQFSLENPSYTLLSRAELNAGLDVLIMNDAYMRGSGSFTSSMSLPQLLKLYYSNKGLPTFPELKACNRMNLYKNLDTQTIYDQALNFMYAYQDDFRTLKEQININKDNFPLIESTFMKYLTAARSVMESFINSYSHDDEGYASCSSSAGGNGKFGGNFGGSSLPLSETVTDLIAIYAEQGTPDNVRDQRQTISDVARRLRMGSSTSALGVMRASDGAWLLPYSNVTNLGDWACNFTADYSASGGSASRSDGVTLILNQLSHHYDALYRRGRQEPDTSSGRSQVVVWQVPGAVPGDGATNNKTIQTFREAYPDVRIIFVGRNRSPYEYLLDDEDDFLSITDKSIDGVSEGTISKVQDSPRYFMYPACDPENPNITNYQNYNENSHIYTGAVTPNFTTYIRIPPHNYRYAEEITLKIEGNVRTCSSRTNRYASDDYVVENINNERVLPSVHDTVYCVGGPDDEQADTITYTWPCDRYVTTCNPIYLAVTALSVGTSQTGCTGANSVCDFPHQVQYKLSHTGMTCGAATSLPALLLVLLPTFLHYYLH